jgi:hypothetical protein
MAGAPGRRGIAILLLMLTAGSCSAAGPLPSATSVGLPEASSAMVSPAAPTGASPEPTGSPTASSEVPAVPLTTVPEVASASSAPARLPTVTESTELPRTSDAATTQPAASSFRSSISAIDPAMATRMAASWRRGCPVALADLRYLTLSYRDFQGAEHTGELVVAADVADDVVAVFRTLFEKHYPIASMRLVDDFGGSDDASMAVDNTSAFNCRAVTGGSSFSEHSYGTAIDVNPVQNPYVRGSTVLPPAGAAFAKRPKGAGVIHGGDDVVDAFAAIGWSWGGYWSRPTDYQHFSRSGR